MLKKFLTISLVAVILSVTAFATPTPIAPMTAAMAETDEPVIVTAKGTATAENMEEILIVTNGESGATIESYNWGSYTHTLGTNWLLVKVAIDEDWVLNQTTMNLQVRLRYLGTPTVTVAPLTKAEFDSALTAMKNEETISGLVAPVNATNKDSKQGATKSTRGQGTISDIEITGSYYDENNYVDGYLYMAIQYTGTEGTTVQMQTGHKDYYILTLDGYKTLPTDVATVTTAYITGDATEQTIDCEADGTEGLEVVSATKWAFYKMNTGYTYENVNSVSLTVPTYKASSLTSTIHLYALTEEEWNAATAGGDNTLKVADKQNLFVSPYVNKTSFLKKNTAATKTEYTFDLTEKYAEKAKSGVIYLCLGYASNGATDPRTGTIYTPTLTITGTHGEYTAPAVATLDDSYLAWNGANYSLYTTATSGTAMLIAATFNGTTMVDAEAITLDASTATNGVISGATTLNAGENLRVFLWNNGTLTPIKNVIQF